MHKHAQSMYHWIYPCDYHSVLRDLAALLSSISDLASCEAQNLKQSEAKVNTWLKTIHSRQDNNKTTVLYTKMAGKLSVCFILQGTSFLCIVTIWLFETLKPDADRDYSSCIIPNASFRTCHPRGTHYLASS